MDEPRESEPTRLPLPWLVLAGLPPACLVALVALFAVDLPYWDQFAFVRHLVAWHDGSLRLADLWIPHNEHRLFVPQLVMLSLATVSGWDVRWEMWLQVALALWLAWGLVRLLGSEGLRRGGAIPLLLSILVFSPSQWRNWTWGWQIQIVLVVLSAVGVVLALRRRTTRHLLLAALWAAVGSISFANGLLLWVVAVPMVVWTVDGAPRKPAVRDLLRLTLWLVLGVAVWLAYFHGFRPATDPAPDLEPLRALLHFGAYVVLYLAAPLLRFHDQLALWGGAVAVGLSLLWMAWTTRRLVRRRMFADALPWLTLAAFAGASACLTAVGRLDLGIGQALSSRYVTIANLFWIGVLGLLAVSLRELDDARPAVHRAILLALTAALVVNAADGARAMASDAADRHSVRGRIAAVAPAEWSAADLAFLYPGPEEARAELRRLRERRLGPFRDLPIRDLPERP